uniref:Metalloprotease TIKI homolog n=1 Tax=Meloidogyne hapla TaxID=6305 RepID=A0A1I8BD28_MELHA
MSNKLNLKNEEIILNNKSLFKQIYWLIPPFLAFLILALLLLALLTAIIGLLLPTFLKINKIEEKTNSENNSEICLNNQNINSFLWLINATWLSSPSFLFGTIHVPFNKVWENNKMPPQIERAFKSSNSVVLELALQKPEIVQQLIRCKQLSNSGNLRDILPNELFNRLKEYMQRIRLKLVRHAYMTHRRRSHARRHVKRLFPNDWEIRRPIWLLFLLFQLGDSPPHLQGTGSQIMTAPMLDLYLAQLANEQNKNLISMETVSEQCNPTHLIKPEQIIFAINYTLNYIEWTEKREEEINNLNLNSQSINKLIKHYKCGTLQVGIEQLVFGAHSFAQNGFYTTLEQDKIAKE